MSLVNLADEIVDLMLREHQSIFLELEHIGRLINDASGSLTASFDELNKITAIQNKLINSGLQKSNSDNKNDLETSKNLDNQFKKNQLKIITALQFDDIVQQLTKHAQSRTSQIQMMFDKLATGIEELKNNNYQYNSEDNSTIRELNADVQKLRIELEKESPVKQTSLSTGKTELF